jgi:hypothetical protein
MYPNLPQEEWKKFHPSQSEIEAAAHELFRAGKHHSWFRGVQSQYDELDPIGKEEFEEIVAMPGRRRGNLREARLCTDDPSG